jgi:hypothetical protein
MSDRIQEDLTQIFHVKRLAELGDDLPSVIL